MPDVHIDLQLATDSETESLLPKMEDFQKWAIAAVQGQDDKEHEITIRIVEKTESQTLNSEYRGKDKPTNVLSFPFEPFPFEAPEQMAINLLGDLVICAPVVKLEAEEQGKSLSAHWAHMVIHGILHLQGYDHIEDSDAEVMEQIEIDTLARLGFDNPYLEQE